MMSHLPVQDHTQSAHSRERVTVHAAPSGASILPHAQLSHDTQLTETFPGTTRRVWKAVDSEYKDSCSLDSPIHDHVDTKKL